MTNTPHLATSLSCFALLLASMASCGKKDEAAPKENAPTVTAAPTPSPSTAPEPTPAVSEHYVGGESVTAQGRLESISSTPVEGSTLEAVVLTISTDGTSGKRLHCKLTLGATAPELATGSPITITGKVAPKDTESLEDCAMLAK